ncbi:MAG: HAMP domain-containing protein [Desulfobacterales bacterium]|jgi:HAMP domain-containing protein|nr:HAMP domain-containing protein [Desulfobacterales bacterium]
MANKGIKGIGLLPKLLFGVFIPIVVAFLVIGVMVFTGVNVKGLKFASLKEIGTQSLRELNAVSLKESKASLDKLAEKIIREKAIDVAAQIEIFVQSHPKMKRDDLLKDPWLKEIAVQKVGETGYTAVHDTQGINYFHVNPQIVGTDLHQLATPLPAFWKILEASLKGPASGYYDWKDADGKIRPKYMYLAPVKGTDLIVASTTYIEEFSRPSQAIEVRMKQIERGFLEEYEEKSQIFYFIILVVLIILLAVIYFYSRSVIRPIRHLSEVADKISMGELDTPIQIRAKGEVRVLAESIERMQTSVKAAIERLQKRREKK